MKKFISVMLCAVMICSLFVLPACNKKSGETATAAPNASAQPAETAEASAEPADETDIRIAALKGPTGMGMVKLIGDEYPHYNVSIESAPDALAPRGGADGGGEDFGGSGREGADPGGPGDDALRRGPDRKEAASNPSPEAFRD